MGKHSKPECYFKNDTCTPGELTFLSWFQMPDKTKGVFACPKHDMQETSRYLKG